ncbi:MAG: DUF3102 domain-containing protein [Caldilineaceae bacterium]|nr:DUF3102 domain-containing protein [Caldilineaceae bacterium]
MRQATPDLLAAQPAPADFNLVEAMTAAPLAPALRYDYASLGTAGESIRRHVLAFKSAEKRMAENTIAAGIELIAIRETIPHNHWLPLLADELGMGERAAQVLMQTARRFGSKAQTYADLTPSVLALLAPPSVPDAAIEAAIAANAASPITVTAARAIIAAHRPARCRKCGRTLTDPDAIRAGIGSCCAARLAQGAAAGAAMGDMDAVDVVDSVDALPEWATAFDERSAEPSAIADLAPAPTVAPPQGDSGANEETHADGKLDVLARLAQRLSDLVGVMRELGQSYGEVTGDFTTPLEVKHRLERMQVRVQANMPNGGWE